MPLFFHYYAKHINAERLGSAWCRLPGALRLRVFLRVDPHRRGRRAAPYGLGVDRATRAANKAAQKQLDRQLALEAELVPCPHCNWINDELVAGFRRGSYRSVSQAAAPILVAGCLLATFMGMFFHFAPNFPAALLIIPGMVLAFGFGLLLLRYWLCRRIRPNRDYPIAPTLPPGSAPALLKDPESGRLVRANKQPLSLEANRDWVDYQIGRHRLPRVCCDCRQPTAPDGGVRLRITKTMWLTIPRCDDCSLSAKHRFRRLCWNGALAGLAITSAIVIPINLDWIDFAVASVILLTLSLIVTAFVAGRMTAPAKVAGGDPSRGVIRLRFRNADYARAVAESQHG